MPQIATPSFPHVPDFSGIEAVLVRIETAIGHIDTGLFVTGCWVGAVTVFCLWFLSTRFYGRNHESRSNQ